MKQFFKSLIGMQPRIKEVRQNQIEVAEREEVEHRANAEYHAAMAQMYAARRYRLQAEQISAERVLQGEQDVA